MTIHVDPAAEAAALESGALIYVPLNKLKPSPRNARRTPHSPAAIEALAASIAVKGIIQPPVIEPEHDADGAPTGFYFVTVGEGRRQAQLLRARRKEIRKTELVRCILDLMNDPHEISLDENVTRSDMHPADQFEAFIFLNDSYIAGTHLNDVTVIQPIFWRGQRVGFAASRAHWLDVGGKDTGLQIDTTEIYQEGMRWAPTKIYEAGRVRTEILDFLRRNSRFGAVLIGDLHAQIAAGQTGAQRLCALLDRRLLAGPRERRRRALRVPSEPTGRDTRICTLTANALPEHVRESIVAGADRHLGKPLSAEALLTLVGELLQ